MMQEAGEVVDDLGKVTATNGDPITIKIPRILPCLRCLTPQVKLHTWEHDNGRKSYQCECENGHCWDEWLDTEAEAITAWNERPIYVMTSAEVK